MLKRDLAYVFGMLGILGCGRESFSVAWPDTSAAKSVLFAAEDSGGIIHMQVAEGPPERWTFPTDDESAKVYLLSSDRTLEELRLHAGPVESAGASAPETRLIAPLFALEPRVAEVGRSIEAEWVTTDDVGSRLGGVRISEDATLCDPARTRQVNARTPLEVDAHACVFRSASSFMCVGRALEREEGVWNVSAGVSWFSITSTSVELRSHVKILEADDLSAIAQDGERFYAYDEAGRFYELDSAGAVVRSIAPPWSRPSSLIQGSDGVYVVRPTEGRVFRLTHTSSTPVEVTGFPDRIMALAIRDANWMVAISAESYLPSDRSLSRFRPIATHPKVWVFDGVRWTRELEVEGQVTAASAFVGPSISAVSWNGDVWVREEGEWHSYLSAEVGGSTGTKNGMGELTAGRLLVSGDVGIGAILDPRRGWCTLRTGTDRDLFGPHVSSDGQQALLSAGAVLRENAEGQLTVGGGSWLTWIDLDPE